MTEARKSGLSGSEGLERELWDRVHRSVDSRDLRDLMRRAAETLEKQRRMLGINLRTLRKFESGFRRDHEQTSRIADLLQDFLTPNPDDLEPEIREAESVR